MFLKHLLEWLIGRTRFQGCKWPSKLLHWQLLGFVVATRHMKPLEHCGGALIFTALAENEKDGNVLSY
jgi:hypothetical protein